MNSIRDRKLVLILFVLVVFVCAIHMAGPAAAAYKLFDKGSKKQYDSYEHAYYTYSWKSYKNGKNKVKVKDRVYWHDNGEVTTGGYILTKISKTKLKIVDIAEGRKKTIYLKTRLSAYQFYKKYFNKKGRDGFIAVLSASKLKLFDQGSRTYISGSKILFTWKAYNKGNNYVYVKSNYYSYKYRTNRAMKYYFQKINSNTLRIKKIFQGKTYTNYYNTPMTAVQYYWKYRP